MKTKQICLLAVLLFLCSCTRPAPPDPLPDEPSRPGWTCLPSDDRAFEGRSRNMSEMLQVTENYLYFNGGDWDGAVPMRLNLETGNVTSVCPDPLCTHDSPDCPLYGTNGFIAPDDASILARRMYSATEDTITGQEISERVNQIMRFEPGTGKRIVLEELGTQGGFSPEVYAGKYRFYNAQIYDDEGEWIGGLARMDLGNGKTELLFDGYHWLLFEKDGRVWVSDGDGFYSFEAEAASPALRREFGGASAEAGEYASFSTDGRNLYVTEFQKKEVRVLPMDGSAETVVTVDFADYNYRLYPTENWLYYFSGKTTVIGDARVSGYASDKVELYGTEFRRCRADGSEDTGVFRFEGEYASFRPIHIAVAGRYLYCTYSWWEDPDGDGVFRDGGQHYSFPVNGHDNCSLLRIDCETGEAEIVTIREGTK